MIHKLFHCNYFAMIEVKNIWIIAMSTMTWKYFCNLRHHYHHVLWQNILPVKSLRRKIASRDLLLQSQTISFLRVKYGKWRECARHSFHSVLLWTRNKCTEKSDELSSDLAMFVQNDQNLKPWITSDWGWVEGIYGYFWNQWTLRF